jgi:hypothetical protein
MKSFHARLRALERTAKRISGRGHLGIWIAAVGGDAAAAEELRRLRSRGQLAGCLDELYWAITYPVQTEPPQPEEIKTTLNRVIRIVRFVRCSGSGSDLTLGARPRQHVGTTICRREHNNRCMSEHHDFPVQVNKRTAEDGSGCENQRRDTSIGTGARQSST